MGSEEVFEDFWAHLQHFTEEHDVEEPAAPRKRRVPKRYEEPGAAPMNTQQQHKITTARCTMKRLTWLCRVWITDSISLAIYRVYKNLESLLLKSALQVDCSSKMEAVTGFYKGDFKPDDLKSQLTTIGIGFSSTNKEGSGSTVNSIIQYIRNLSACQQSLYLRSSSWSSCSWSPLPPMPALREHSVL